MYLRVTCTASATAEVAYAMHSRVNYLKGTVRHTIRFGEDDAHDDTLKRLPPRAVTRSLQRRIEHYVSSEVEVTLAV